MGFGNRLQILSSGQKFSLCSLGDGKIGFSSFTSFSERCGGSPFMVLETLPPLRSSSVMLPCWPADVGLTDNIQKRRMKEERGPSSLRSSSSSSQDYIIQRTHRGGGRRMRPRGDLLSLGGKGGLGLMPPSVSRKKASYSSSSYARSPPLSQVCSGRTEIEREGKGGSASGGVRGRWKGRGEKAMREQQEGE